MTDFTPCPRTRREPEWLAVRQALLDATFADGDPLIVQQGFATRKMICTVLADRVIRALIKEKNDD